jgi:1,5-anhydro-D-fructose reductase (1,5-anhydro-D-mannitol-forming)
VRVSAPLRVAALGAWHVHVDDYARQIVEHPAATLAYVWDPDSARGSEVAARWGVPLVTGDAVERVLRENPVDAVAVTVAPVDKTRTILASLRAGVHVVTEKPVALGEVEVRELQREAVVADRHLWLSLPFQHSPAVEVARLSMEQGRLGDITEIRVRMGIDGAVAGWLPERFLDPDEALGGVLADLICHPLAIVNRLLDDAEPESAVCVKASTRSRRVEDHAIVIQGYPSGVITQVESSFVDRPGGSFAFEITGTAGMLTWDAASGRCLLHPADRSTVEVPLDDPRQHPGADFLDAVVGGRPIGATFAEAIALSRALDRIVDSAQL